MSEYEISVMGMVGAASLGRGVAKFPTAKTELLLAYLAVNAGSEVPRSEAIEALWPGAPMGAARHRLNQALSALRKLLASAAIPVEIESGRRFIRLRAEAVQVDALRFEEGARRGGSVDDRLAALRAYRGPFAPGHQGEWVERRRDALESKLRKFAGGIVDERPDLADEVEAHLARVLRRADAPSCALPNVCVRPIGREAEIEMLGDVVRLGCRTLCIVGLPGSGKTVLAIELARRLSNEFAMTELRRPASLTPDPVQEDQLLVLDAATPETARPIGGTVISTSREPPNWPDAHIHRLAGVDESSAEQIVRSRTKAGDYDGEARAAVDDLGRLPGLLIRFADLTRSEGFAEAARKVREARLPGPRHGVPRRLEPLLEVLACVPGGLTGTAIAALLGEGTEDLIAEARALGLVAGSSESEGSLRLAPGVRHLMPAPHPQTEARWREEVALRFEALARESGEADPGKLVPTADAYMGSSPGCAGRARTVERSISPYA